MYESELKKLIDGLITDENSPFFKPYTKGGFNKYTNIRNKKTYTLLPNCTGGAFGIAEQLQETTNYEDVDLPKANAGNWYKGSSREKSQFPVLGAVACWSGHVGTVVGLQRNSNGDVCGNTIKILESSYYGYKGKNWRTYDYKYTNTSGKLTKSGQKFQGYLLLPGVEPDPVENKLEVGDCVQIIAKGNSRSNGKGRAANGVGYKRYIIKIYPDAAYPYRVGTKNGKSTTGYYKAEALKEI